MSPDDLRSWRQRHRLNQTEAGRILRRTQSTISLYERGAETIAPELLLAMRGWDAMTDAERAEYLAGRAG